MDNQIKDKIQKLIDSSPVMVYEGHKINASMWLLIM